MCRTQENFLFLSKFNSQYLLCVYKYPHTRWWNVGVMLFTCESSSKFKEARTRVLLDNALSYLSEQLERADMRVISSPYFIYLFSFCSDYRSSYASYLVLKSKRDVFKDRYKLTCRYNIPSLILLYSIFALSLPQPIYNFLYLKIEFAISSFLTL